MPTVNDFHPEAMDLAELAFQFRRRGDETKAQEFFLQAMKLEQAAAYLLPPVRESEPSRSILYRSAASLAHNAGQYETADWLVANGLAGFPPEEIKRELKDLYEDINFMRHLAVRGVKLSEAQWLMSISGNATNYGGTLADALMMRMDKVSTVVYRTIERLLKQPYRTKGSVSREIKKAYSLYVSALAPGSFAVVFQLGAPVVQMSFLPDSAARQIDPSSVITEMLECLSILEGDDPARLKERIRDETYYENFVALAKQIAPDGDDVKIVSFEQVRHPGEEKRVYLRKNRQQLRETASLSTAEGNQVEPPIRLTYTGLLRGADSPERRKHGIVKLTETVSKQTYFIRVPIALMKDVVQPYYGEIVTVQVFEKDEKLYLEEIDFAT
jgi:hypothetical protein